MKRKDMKIISYILIFVIVSTTIFNIYYESVYAQEIIIDIVKELFFSAMGESGTVVNKDIIDNMYNQFGGRMDSIYLSVRDNPDGTVTLSAESMQQIRDLFDEYLEKNPQEIDVVWIPVINEKDLRSSWFNNNTDLYYNVLKLFDTYDFVGLFRQINARGVPYLSWGDESGTYTPFIDLSGFSMSLNQSTGFNNTQINSFNFLTNNFGRDTTVNPLDVNEVFFIDRNSYVAPKWQRVYSDGLVDYWPENYYVKRYRCVFNPYYAGNVVSFGQGRHFIPVVSSRTGIGYIPLFADILSYSDWITGNGNYYRFNSDYAGGDLTINPNADYSKLQDALQDVFKQSAANGDNMETLLTRLQVTFSKTLDEINNTLGDIEDNTAATNSWLEKIYNKLDDIYKKLKSLVFVDTVDTATDFFTKIWDSVFDWIQTALQLNDVISQATELGNVIKTRFPFSIPWDVYAILLMLDAPAKPPVIALHFEFPMIDFVYDYEYSMNEKVWYDAAAVSRFFLTISYEIALMHLTQKLYGSGLFDLPRVGGKKR